MSARPLPRLQVDVGLLVALTRHVDLRLALLGYMHLRRLLTDLDLRRRHADSDLRLRNVDRDRRRRLVHEDHRVSVVRTAMSLVSAPVRPPSRSWSRLRPRIALAATNFCIADIG